MIRASIAGATGYTGGELCRLLLSHPDVTITHLFSLSNVGAQFGSIYPQLEDLSHMVLEEMNPAVLADDIDVLFLALPHATSHTMMTDILTHHPHLKVIDLSADFRLNSADAFEHCYGVPHAAADLLSEGVYGCVELYQDRIKEARLIAVPGCYATAIILGLAPLYEAGILSKKVIIDAKSGVSGAGKALHESSQYCDANEVMTAYNTGQHRHMSELQMQFPGYQLMFSPHLSPQNRGILASMYMDNTEGLSESELTTFYTDFYSQSPFVCIKNLARPSTRYVTGSNMVMITAKIDYETNTIVIFSAIDNLVKGASGQAIQAMNLCFGLEETLGLPQTAQLI